VAPGRSSRAATTPVSGLPTPPPTPKSGMPPAAVKAPPPPPTPRPAAPRIDLDVAPPPMNSPHSAEWLKWLAVVAVALATAVVTFRFLF
jgi:hypothetical protein